jgi:hypothetical protein
MRFGGRTQCTKHHTLQGRKSDDAGVGVAVEKTGQGLKSERVERLKTRTPRTETYILERTWVLFTGRSDEPCSEAACLAPTDSEAGTGAPLTRGLPPSSPWLDDGTALPRLLGGYPSELHHDRGWPLAPAGREGNLYFWGSAAPDDQRLKAPRGSARIRLHRRARRRR